MSVQIIDSLTERTTSATDLLVAIIAFVATISLVKLYPQSKGNFKLIVWVGTMFLLVLASLLGAIAHGFRLSPKVKQALWQPLNFILGLIVALFVVGVTYDLWGEAAAKYILPFMIGIAAVFYVVTAFKPATFLPFIVYEAVAMLFALLGYISIGIRGDMPGAWLLAAGVLTTIIAAGIQAGIKAGVSFSCVWKLDHNGIYHIVQMPGVVLIWFGLLRSFGA